ncbi:MAG: hypothetical protein WCV67_19910 [Victivallaceae bacterium]|jgi:hypothetical protein
MDHLQITGGSIIRSADCESLLSGVRYSFNNLGELKDKLSDADWKKGNWSYFRRFSPDAQFFTLGAGLALRDSGIKFVPELTIGLLAADDFEHESDQSAYFSDYVEGGRELGSSSLFVHTLPTSSAVDASVCLGLRGPLLYIRDESNIWGELLNTAGDFIASGDAEIMLLSYRMANTLVCLTLAAGGSAPISRTAQATPDAIFEFARNAVAGKMK